MTTLNKYAKEAMDKVKSINSVTDVTGFGLLGHALEMAEASQVSLIIDSSAIPVLPNAPKYASMGLVPAGAYSNRSYIGDKVAFKDGVSEVMKDILYDPQTSGGLLIAVDRDYQEDLLKALEDSSTDYAIIGEVIEKSATYIQVE